MPTRLITRIVIHCSATASGKPLQQGTPGQPGHKNAVQVINAWHAQRGWARKPSALQARNPHLGSIGYHYVIDLDGQVWTGRGLDETGAHVAGHNQDTVGICLVGGVERVGRYTHGQWRSLAEVLRMLSGHCQVPLTFSRGPGHPGVCGHRDLSPDLNGDGRITSQEWVKTCPGFEVGDWLARGMDPLPQHIYREGA